MTVGTSDTAVGVATWTIPTVTDNRDHQLQLFMSVGNSDQVLLWSRTSAAENVPSISVPDISIGPINVTFLTEDGAQKVTVPVQLPLLPQLQLQYVAGDLYGNEQVYSFEVAVEDDQPPGLELVGAQLVVNLTEGEARAEVLRDDLIAQVSDNTAFAVTIVAPRNVMDSYAVGITEVAVTAEDAWGNQHTKTISIVVQDVETPTARCLPDIAVPASSAEGAKATWGTMPVSDNTDPRGNSLRIEASHQSGDVFPLGDTRVTMMVFDASNNSAECNFNVAVSEVGSAASAGAVDSTSTIGAGAGAGVLLLVASTLAFFVYRARQLARQPADWDQVFAMIDQLKNADGETNRPREIARSAMTLLEELGKGMPFAS